jgi:hypothetical protein
MPIEDIVEGRPPVELMATRLKRMTDLPLSWEAQRRVPGFPNCCLAAYGPGETLCILWAIGREAGVCMANS